jgi:hypothetical protein
MIYGASATNHAIAHSRREKKICLAFRDVSSLRPHFQALRIITSRYCVVKVLSLPYLVPTLLVATIRK